METQALPPSSSELNESDARLWAMLAHLSAIIASFLGGMAFLGPLLVWIIYKDKSTFVDYHAKEALNFQILMSIAFVIGIILAIITCGVGAVVLPIVGLLDFIFVIIAGIKAYNGEYYQYPFNWRIVK
ncbi:MAG: DUF4870 domain-containing protein [Siphonobacter sp.]